MNIQAPKRPLLFWLAELCPNIFYKPFTPEQTRAVNVFEKQVRLRESGHLFMNRGTGATSLAICGSIWAALEGFAEFPIIVGESTDTARHHCEWVRRIIEKSPVAERYPEIRLPLNRLRTPLMLEFAGKHIRFAGIRGSLLGFRAGNLRPDLVIVDSPLSVLARKSVSITAEVDRVIREDLPSLGGAAAKIPVIVLDSVE